MEANVAHQMLFLCEMLEVSIEEESLINSEDDAGDIFSAASTFMRRNLQRTEGYLPEPKNDFCDVGILSQSQFSPNNTRTTARGVRFEEHSSFILSWNLIGQGETKVITSQKSFPGSVSETLFFGGIK